MPSLPTRYCEVQGCKATASGNRCEAHKRKVARMYDETPDRKQTHKTLQSARWRRLRIMHLREHPLCVDCPMPATQVDHIVPRRLDDDAWFDPDNLQSMCASCHARKTARGE